MDTTTLVGFLCTCLGGYFAIMNPIANTPVFISLTQGDDAATKKAVARNSILFAFALIAFLSFAGNFILAGPGTIAVAMGYAAGFELIHVILSLLAFGVICGITYLCFRGSEEIVEHLGQNGLNVITRLMGLCLAAIGTGMVLSGLGADIHTFMGTVS